MRENYSIEKMLELAVTLVPEVVETFASHCSLFSSFLKVGIFILTVTSPFELVVVFFVTSRSLRPGLCSPICTGVLAGKPLILICTVEPGAPLDGERTTAGCGSDIA